MSKVTSVRLDDELLSMLVKKIELIGMSRFIKQLGYNPLTAPKLSKSSVIELAVLYLNRVYDEHNEI